HTSRSPKMQATQTPRPGVYRHVRALLTSPISRALAWPHGVDRYLELIDPKWSTAEIRATVTDVVQETAQSTTIVLEPNANWRGHEAGQFVELTVAIDGVRHTRCYSITTSARQL